MQGDRSQMLPLLLSSRAAFAMACLASAVAWTPASAQDTVAAFYRGKTVQVIIPTSPGGSVSLYGRLFADNIGRHIPGNPTVVSSQMPGAGGITSVEYVMNIAPKDGTVIGEILSPALLVPLMRAVRFEPAHLHWIGSLTNRPGVVAVWHTARATTLEAVKTTEINMGSSGVGAGNFQIPTLSNLILGTKFKVVPGYKSGGDINLAIERGEVDGRFNYWSGFTSVRPEWVRDGKLKFLFRTGPRAPDMPELPSFRELAPTEDDRQMVRIIEAPDDVGVGFYLAPRVPAERSLALRRAFAALMQDGKFLAEAKRLDVPIEPVGPDELQKIVAAISATTPALAERFRKAIGPKK
jgi:tripartite-type tricarboxylate transporter receptor subunit TctC